MVDCIATQQVTGLHGRFHGGELKIFFSKLASWLQSPIALVFVFDGNEKLKIKRGTKVICKDLWWEELSKEPITLCGYYWVQVHYIHSCICCHLNSVLTYWRKKKRQNLVHSMSVTSLMESLLQMEMPLYLVQKKSFECKSFTQIDYALMLPQAYQV